MAQKNATDAATADEHNTTIESDDDEGKLSEKQQKEQDFVMPGETLLGKHTYAKRCKPRHAQKAFGEEGSCCIDR